MVKNFLSIITLGIIFLSIMPAENYAQDSYKTVFPFLNMTPAARPASMGGNHIALFEGQSDMMHINPAYINPEDHKSITLSYLNHLSDINFGFVTTSYHLNGIGTIGTGIRYASYGQFDHTNESGEKLGTFQASDIAMNGAISRNYKGLQYGASIDIIHSSYDQYNSTAIGISAGALYELPSGKTNFAAVIKNFGTQVTYYNGKRESFPLDLLLGVSHKPEHVPMRFSLTLQKLNNWDMRSYGEANKPPFAELLFRHAILANEILLGDHVRLRVGYNQYIHDQIQSDNRLDTGGINFGIGIKFDRYRFDVSRNSYSDLGGLLQLSIKASFNDSQS